jgi:hypothetical protein
MGIKIGLTGHTRDFGPYLVEALENRFKVINEYSAENAEWIGFSRSTGHDITNADHVESIFDEEMSVIINNAEAGNGQMLVAQAALKNNVPCLTIGSKITEVDVRTLGSQEAAKKSKKVEVKEFAEANNQNYISFGFVAPSPYIDINPAVEEKGMTPENAAEIVVSKLNDMGII